MLGIPPVLSGFASVAASESSGLDKGQGKTATALPRPRRPRDIPSSTRSSARAPARTAHSGRPFRPGEGNGGPGSNAPELGPDTARNREEPARPPSREGRKGRWRYLAGSGSCSARRPSAPGLRSTQGPYRPHDTCGSGGHGHGHCTPQARVLRLKRSGTQQTSPLPRPKRRKCLPPPDGAESTTGRGHARSGVTGRAPRRTDRSQAAAAIAEGSSAGPAAASG